MFISLYRKLPKIIKEKNEKIIVANLREDGLDLSDEDIKKLNLAMFDARVFQVPSIDEMVNAIIFRQQDCTRNSISMAAYWELGDAATKNKSGTEKQEMLFQLKGINWNDYKTKYKRGTVIRKITFEKLGPNGEKAIRSKWDADPEIPIFTQDKEYITKLIPTTK